jgi:hypothetical protein
MEVLKDFGYNNPEIFDSSCELVDFEKLIQDDKNFFVY